MDLGSRVLLGRQLGGRVAFTMEVSEAAARKMKAAIGAVQALAGCARKGGLDFALGEDFGFKTWPPELLDLQIAEISKAGVHVSGAVRLDLSGPLQVDRFPALSVQLCSAPDAMLRHAEGGGAAGGGAAETSSIGLGRASSVIDNAVASANRNWTEAQAKHYRDSHATYSEGCIATVALQPFSMVRGQPFELAFDLAMPFYGNSSARFYGPLYFAEEISRGGALVLRGSYDSEIAELGAKVFNGTYMASKGRATSGCFLHRVMQEVRVRAHLLRILPDAAPYIKDALLGASCMAGVFLHYFSHDNSTALNDDRVLEDCFAFMESSMGIGLDPSRKKAEPAPPKQPHQAPGVRVPRPLGASFKPAPRDLSGRSLYRFGPVPGASTFEGVACRWLNTEDASSHYSRGRHTPDVLSCEAACLKARECWGIHFDEPTGHCELWNRVPRAIALDAGSTCLALEPQGSAFQLPGEDAQLEGDGWLALLAGAKNHSLIEELLEGAAGWADPADGDDD
ncbi:hypothetical protein T492DRAFT_988681 [Pavlovales sp. CCMP2436]|nr:hypothetical protein T492DRAFT_988681 [Pavlovales sp. CCMP2436]